MKHLVSLLAVLTSAQAQEVKRDIPYTKNADKLQVLDVYSPPKDKGIPPFFILHVANHPDVTAQAQRPGNVLKDAGVPVTVFGARETTHNKINADLGKSDDPATVAMFEFCAKSAEIGDCR